MLANSLERLIPNQVEPNEVTGQLTLALHRSRYEFAAAQCNPGRLLAIACGVGYGTPILYRGNNRNLQALGVDCSKDSIEYATGKYSMPGVHFLMADAMKFEDPDGFDTIVSLETIEHIPDPSGLIANLVQILRPGGVLIGSVPTTPTVAANPYHLHDFTEDSFRKLIEPYGLTEVACLRQIQPFNPITVLTRKERRLEDLRCNLGKYYWAHPLSFWKRICSTLQCGFSNRYITIAWRLNTS